MDMYLGVISEIRQDVLRPIKVAFNTSGGSLEEYLVIGLGAWYGTFGSGVQVGQEVAVWDTGYGQSLDRFRVMEFFPLEGQPLSENDSEPARKGATVKITGSIQLTQLVAASILAAGVTPLPVPISIPISAKGEVI
jgi:hypothetical protein